MRICTHKSTGKIIEMQSHATVGTLIHNAVSSGYAEGDVVEEEVTPQQYAERMAVPVNAPKPPPTTEQQAAAWMNQPGVTALIEAITEIHQSKGGVPILPADRAQVTALAIAKMKVKL
jgi:hypothetical protein